MYRRADTDFIWSSEVSTDLRCNIDFENIFDYLERDFISLLLA